MNLTKSDCLGIALFLILGGLVLMLTACGGSSREQYSPAPAESLKYSPTAVIASPGGEGTPVVFQGQVLTIMGVRVGPSTGNVQIVSDVLLTEFQAPMTLICAFVEGDTLYIFGVTGFDFNAGLSAYGNSVVRMSTKDLLTWETETVYTFPAHIAGYNLSVSPAPNGYIMAYDFGPPWQQGFLFSPDLTHWAEQPGYFQSPPWSSAVTIRYLEGYYYLFYSTQDDKGMFYTGAVRSTDRFSWEPAVKSVIYPTEPVHRINTTDFDMVEVNGQVHAVFAVGDQSGNGAMATAVYNGDFRQMVKDLF